MGDASRQFPPGVVTPFVNDDFGDVFGFFFVFVCGGLTGIMLAMVPFDWQAHDTYFVVAHLHYVVAGALAFPMLAGMYYWLPLLTGRTTVRGLSTLAFWLVFVGFNLTFFMMHLTGLMGMPRRVYTFYGDEGWNWLNLLSSVGGFVMTIGFALLVVDLVVQLRYGRRVRRDPWGATTLEWAMPLPPPPYGFASIPHVGRETDGIAQHGHQREFAQRAQVAVLRDDQGAAVAFGAHAQANVVGDQRVVAAPTRQRQAQRGRAERGPRQHAVAAPGQAAGEPAKTFIVQLAHGEIRERFHL